jgi:hypothetical protein
MTDSPPPADDPKANNAAGAGCMTRIVRLGSMYNAWAAFVDIRRDRRHEFPTYEDWILSDDTECRSFRQGWAAMGSIIRDPKRYPDPIDEVPTNKEL